MNTDQPTVVDADPRRRSVSVATGAETPTSRGAGMTLTGRIRGYLALVVGLLSMMFAPFAGASNLPVQGGPGGKPFRSDCSGGGYVAGIYVRSGDWIDAIGLKCATYDRLALTFTRPAWNTPYNGGSGAGLLEREKLCPADSSVSGLLIGYTTDGSRPKFVDHVMMVCRDVKGATKATSCFDTGDGCWFTRPNGDNPLRAFGQACPDNELATGIRGRAGNYVDAIGLVCSLKPQPPKILVLRRPTTTPPRTVTAPEDVDMYNGPGPEPKFTILGVMAAGTKAEVLESHPDGWCKLKGVAAGADAWVAEDHLQPRNCAF